MTNGSATPPGWYDDSTGRQRWWDGETWGPYLDEAYPQAAQAAPAAPQATTAAPQAAGVYQVPVAKPRSSKWPWILGIGALLLVLLVGAVAVVGVGVFVYASSGADMMRSSYTKYIDSYKTSDCTEYESVTTSAFRDDEWDGYFTCADFRDNTGSNAWFDPSTFTYKIGAVEVNGDKGTLKVEEKYQDSEQGDAYDDHVTYHFVTDGSTWRIDRMNVDS